MLRAEKIDGVIWDMDGVLHPYKPFGESLTYWNGAAARAFNKIAQTRGIEHDYTPQELHQLALQSFKKYGLSTALFAEKYGISEKELHIEFHRETSMEDVIETHHDLPAAFEALPDVKHVVLTHGSQEWAERCLEKNGLTKYFTDILAFERFDMIKKSESVLPFLHAVDAIKIDPSRLLMVEDTKKNLIIPKNLGMQTAFINENGLEPEWISFPTDADTYVDVKAKNAMHLLSSFVNEPSR